MHANGHASSGAPGAGRSCPPADWVQLHGYMVCSHSCRLSCMYGHVEQDTYAVFITPGMASPNGMARHPNVTLLGMIHRAALHRWPMAYIYRTLYIYKVRTRVTWLQQAMSNVLCMPYTALATTGSCDPSIVLCRYTVPENCYQNLAFSVPGGVCC